MRVAIVGSRDYPDLGDVVAYVRALPGDTVIISGGARGVDRVAEHAAFQRGMTTRIYPAEWERYGKQAGYRRNQQIVADADRLVAFHDGVSRGTQHSIDLARAASKPTLVIIAAAKG